MSFSIQLTSNSTIYYCSFSWCLSYALLPHLPHAPLHNLPHPHPTPMLPFTISPTHPCIPLPHLPHMHTHPTLIFTIFSPSSVDFDWLALTLPDLIMLLDNILVKAIFFPKFQLTLTNWQWLCLTLSKILTDTWLFQNFMQFLVTLIQLSFLLRVIWQNVKGLAKKPTSGTLNTIWEVTGTKLPVLPVPPGHPVSKQNADEWFLGVSVIALSTLVQST